MGVSALEVSSDIRTRLGDDCLQEVCDDLWARDCQTCGRPLGLATPALCLGDLGGYEGVAAYVSLHHATCRSSRWSPRPEVADAAISFITQCFLMPDEWFGVAPKEADRFDMPRPTFVINPSLETTAVNRDGTGAWHVSRNLHRHLGVRGPDDGYMHGRAIAAGYVTLSNPGLVAHLGDNSWSTDITPSFLDSVRAYGGVTLMLTSAFGGGLRDDTDVLRILASPGLEMGWLGLRSART